MPSHPLVAAKIAALQPLLDRVRTDTVWIKRPGRGPFRIDEPLTQAKLEDHLTGGPAVGVAPMVPGSATTRCALLDFDAHAGETSWQDMLNVVEQVIDTASLVGLEATLFRSRGGSGVHAIFLWEQDQSAFAVREALTAVLAAHGLRNGTGGVRNGEVEIFPKQNRIADGAYGSMFIVPGAHESVPLIIDDLLGGLAAGTADDLAHVVFKMSLPVPTVGHSDGGVDDGARVARRAAAALDDMELVAIHGRLREALEVLPNDDGLGYDQWLRVILAVHEACGGSEEGREIAREWSAKSEKHNDETFDRKAWNWASAASAGKSRVISGEFVFSRARAAGWVDPAIINAFPDLDAEAREERAKREAAIIGEHGTLDPISPMPEVMTTPEMIGDLVFISDGSRIAKRGSPQQSMALSDARNHFAASIDSVPSGKSVKEVPRLDRWLKSTNRMTAYTLTFAPGQPEFCLSPEGSSAMNLWQPREQRPYSPRPPLDWQTRVQPFLDHIEYLAPVKHERERLLDWMAHIEQRPGELPQAHYLMVARQTGIGRNWLSYICGRIWAGYVALGFDLEGALRSGFNGALSRKVLAVVDEINEANDASKSGEKLKSMLTERTRLVNPKYGRQHVEFNACRFLIFSNHDAALPLAENDRRVFVISNPEERRPPEYYQAIYRLLDCPLFVGSVIEYLRTRDISGFDPGGIAELNAAKRAVIDAGRSEIAQTMADIAESWPSDCITALDLKREISLVAKIPVDRLTRISTAAQQVGVRARTSTVKVKGELHRAWILRNPTRWSSATHSEFVAEILKGQEQQSSVENFTDLA